jgi:hypothetical protein
MSASPSGSVTMAVSNTEPPGSRVAGRAVRLVTVGGRLSPLLPDEEPWTLVVLPELLPLLLWLPLAPELPVTLPVELEEVLAVPELALVEETVLNSASSQLPA